MTCGKWERRKRNKMEPGFPAGASRSSGVGLMMTRNGKTALLAAVIFLLGIMGIAVSFPARAEAGIGEAVSYIRGRQTSDGGFCEPGKGDSGQETTTAWCIMALAASGVDPGGVRRNGRSPMDFLATQSANWRSVTDYERTILAVVAGGGDPYSFGGVDLVAKVRSYQRPEGNIGDAINSNAFGILAYRAVGLEIPPGAVRWHKSVQNRDGGWGNSPGAASNPDMTAASIMALRAAGVGPGDPSIVSALSYLRTIQNPDGGFAFQSASSDAAATAWCVQALVAAGEDPAGGAWSRDGNTPWSFLLSMQAPDGHFAWMRGRDMNPLWTTAYAACALARKPFPVVVRGASSQAGGGMDSSRGSAGGESSPEAASAGPGEAGQGAAEEGAAEVDTLSGITEDEASAAEENAEVNPAGEGSSGRSSNGMIWLLAGLGGAASLSGALWYFMARKSVTTFFRSKAKD